MNSSTGLLRKLIARAESTLAPDEGDDQSSTESDASTDYDPRALAAGGVWRPASRCVNMVRHDVSMLMELMPTLEAAYRHKFSSRIRRTSPELTSVTHEASRYVGHVLEKFPAAHPEVINRLGEANWQRHERIRNVLSGDEAVDVKPGLAAQPVGAKSFFKPYSLFQDSALGSSLQTTYAPAKSVASGRSFASSTNSSARDALRVPQPPIVTWGEPFTCPFCSDSVCCLSRPSWK